MQHARSNMHATCTVAQLSNMIKKREGGEEAFTSKETHRNEGRPGLPAYVLRVSVCERGGCVPARTSLCACARAHLCARACLLSAECARARAPLFWAETRRTAANIVRWAALVAAQPAIQRPLHSPAVALQTRSRANTRSSTTRTMATRRRKRFGPKCNRVASSAWARIALVRRVPTGTCSTAQNAAPPPCPSGGERRRLQSSQCQAAT